MVEKLGEEVGELISCYISADLPLGACQQVGTFVVVMSWEIARDGIYTRCLIQNETKDTEPIITRFGRRQKCHITSGLATRGNQSRYGIRWYNEVPVTIVTIPCTSSRGGTIQPHVI